jgi:hypothetical protein
LRRSWALMLCTPARTGATSPSPKQQHRVLVQRQQQLLAAQAAAWR